MEVGALFKSRFVRRLPMVVQGVPFSRRLAHCVQPGRWAVCRWLCKMYLFLEVGALCTTWYVGGLLMAVQGVPFRRLHAVHKSLANVVEGKSSALEERGFNPPSSLFFSFTFSFPRFFNAGIESLLYYCREVTEHKPQINPPAAYHRARCRHHLESTTNEGE